MDQPGVDIFGQVYNQWKNKECECPNCKRLIAASRFAPHLEKCLGMGRNSSRIANRRSVSGGHSGVIVGYEHLIRSFNLLYLLTGWPVIITWANQRAIRKTTMTSMITTGRMGRKKKVSVWKIVPRELLWKTSGYFHIINLISVLQPRRESQIRYFFFNVLQ